MKLNISYILVAAAFLASGNAGAQNSNATPPPVKKSSATIHGQQRSVKIPATKLHSSTGAVTAPMDNRTSSDITGAGPSTNAQPVPMDSRSRIVTDPATGSKTSGTTGTSGAGAGTSAPGSVSSSGASHSGTGASGSR